MHTQESGGLEDVDRKMDPPGLSTSLHCVAQVPEQHPEPTGAGGELLSKGAGDTAGS